MRATNRSAAALRLPASGTPGSAVRQAAHQYVVDGEGLGAFLADLELACQVLDLPPPSRELVKEASIAWVDEFLTKTDPLGCEDPLTGMATPEHARRHVRALYRGGTEDRALVVVTLLEPEQRTESEEDVAAAFEQSLRLAMIAETIRASFERCEVVVPLTGGRVLAVVGWDAIVSNRVDELGWLLRRRLPVSSAPRVRLEPMPATEADACALLDDAGARSSADDNGPGHGLTEPAGGDGEADPTGHLEVEPEVE